MQQTKELLKKINQGDNHAFEQVYDLYVKKIYRYIYYKTSSHTQAEDLTSEVFCNSWQHISQGKKINNLNAFIYRIAHNLVVNFYTQKEKHPIELNEELKATIPGKKDFTEDVDINIEVEQIKKIINQLPSSYQEVIRFRYLDELSIVEISNILNKSKNSVYVLIHRALKALKDKI